MKFRKDGNNPAGDQGREEIREIAEALSLYRSAMHHVADRAADQTVVRPLFAGQRPARALRLLLTPALTAAVVIGILVPVSSYSHRHPVLVRPHPQVAQENTQALADVDDTVLMNQIDSEVSQDVPDALRPLADLSDQAASTATASENKNATHE